MRKLLVSATCAGVLAVPASFAFAAEDSQNHTTNGRDGDRRAAQQDGGRSDERPLRITGDASTPAFFELTTNRPIAQASARLDKASNRVETRHDVLRRQRIEAREAREARAAAAAAAAAAAETTVDNGASASSTESAPAGGPTSPQLDAIRSCESGGDYSAVDPSGTYHGAYQFDQSTWESVGGSGSPSAASPAEQDRRAQMLMEQSGSSPWPNCG